MTRPYFSFILLPGPEAFRRPEGDSSRRAPAVMVACGFARREDDVAGLVMTGRTVLSPMPCFSVRITRMGRPDGHFAGYHVDSGDGGVDLAAARRQLCDALQQELVFDTDDGPLESHVLGWDDPGDAPAVTAVHLTEWALVHRAANSKRLTCVYGEQLSPGRDRAAAFADARFLLQSDPRPIT